MNSRSKDPRSKTWETFLAVPTYMAGARRARYEFCQVQRHLGFRLEGSEKRTLNDRIHNSLETDLQNLQALQSSIDARRIIERSKLVKRAQDRCCGDRSGSVSLLALVVRLARRATGDKYFFFRYLTDLLGQEDRKPQTEVIGSTTVQVHSRKPRQAAVNSRVNISQIIKAQILPICDVEGHPGTGVTPSSS
jgi:hypothetical protein